MTAIEARLGARLWLDVAVAAVACAVAYLIGLYAANPLGRLVCAYADVPRLIVRSPDDRLFLPLARAFPLVPAIAWTAGMLERIYLRAAPAPRRLAVYVVPPLLGLAAGLAIQAWDVARAVASAPSDFPVMLTADSLGLTEAAMQWAFIAGVALWLTVALRSKRMARVVRS